MRESTFILEKLWSQLNVDWIRDTKRTTFKECILGFYFIQLIVGYSKVKSNILVLLFVFYFGL